MEPIIFHLDRIKKVLSRVEDIITVIEEGKADLLKPSGIFGLGQVIVYRKLRRSGDNQVGVADLSGVAVQDIQISKAVFEIFKSDKKEVSN
jgi:ornithine cyclodeaminase/alanine dehydrogenase-like protein (mu-crystallin family)